MISQRNDADREKADPALMVIPPVEQYSNKYAFATSEYAGKGTKGYTQNLIITTKYFFSAFNLQRL